MKPFHKTSVKREKQTRYLSQAIQLEEAVNPHIIRATMSMVLLALCTFIGWASVTYIDEIARTPGEVIPHGHEQTIQHLTGGTVKSIHVAEGDIVETGDVIVTLHDDNLRQDLRQTQAKQLSLALQAERLQAFLDKREPDFAKFEAISQAMESDQESFFQGMLSARDNEREVIQSQIYQRMQAIKAIETDLETEKANLVIARNVLNRRQVLNREGYASDMRLLEDEKRYNDVSGAIKRLENQVQTANADIDEYRSRLQSLETSHRDEALEKLAAIKGDMDQNAELISKIEKRIERLAIRSSADGLVKGLAVNTIGSVIAPGQTVASIVPMHETLEVDVKISPQDIGHIKIGQAVKVKFSTYDFSRYGFVDGTLQHISAATFKGDDGKRYYQGRIHLKNAYVGENAMNAVIPGMTVMADIITGRKTILQYLLKPIHLSLKTSFSER